MPMKRSARLVVAASWVIEIELVLVATMTSGASCASSWPRILIFSASVLGGGLDDELGGVQRGVVGRRGDAGEGGGFLLGGELVLLDQAVEAAGDGGQALVHGGVADVDHHDVDAGLRADLRDAVAHGAGADDADGLDRGSAHGGFLFGGCVSGWSFWVPDRPAAGASGLFIQGPPGFCLGAVRPPQPQFIE